MKLGLYDNGALETLQYAIGAGVTSSLGKGLSPRTFNYVPRFQGTGSTVSESVFGYYGFEGTSLKYIGISNNPATRFNAHLNSGTNRAGLNYRTQIKFSTRLDVRIWEQQNINNNGLNTCSTNGMKLGQAYGGVMELKPKHGQ